MECNTDRFLSLESSLLQNYFLVWAAGQTAATADHHADCRVRADKTKIARDRCTTRLQQPVIYKQQVSIKWNCGLRMRVIYWEKC